MNAHVIDRSRLVDAAREIEKRYALEITGTLPDGIVDHPSEKAPLVLIATGKKGLSLLDISSAEVELEDRLRAPVRILLKSELEGGRQKGSCRGVETFVKRTTRERLQDARYFAAEARQIALGMDADIFDQIPYYHYAVRYCLLALGEALRHVPDETQRLAPEIPWRSIINMRHRLAHDYWLTDSRIVLEAADKQAAPLADAVDRLMVQLPDEG